MLNARTLKPYLAPIAIPLLSLALATLTDCSRRALGPAKSGEEAGAKYPIVLERELEPGKEYRVRVQVESTTTRVARSKSKVVKEEKDTKVLTFAGTHRALAAGKNQRAEYVVDELSVVRGGQTQTLLPQRTTILASPVGDSWRYTVDGQPVAEDVHEALASLLGDKTNGPSNDALLGSKAPRAVGERWSVDIIDVPDDYEFAIEREGASGSTRVVALRNVDGVGCLEIAGELSYPKVELKSMPADTKIINAGLSVIFLGLFPTNTKLPPRRTRTIVDLAFTMDGSLPEGPVKWDIVTHSEETTNRQ
ncbi:MAG TPA: hypothetical protein VGP93_08685 [Polyangiaceae bacterium]|nr:hypothetical protein [Polyangiaceae bacterium]